MDETIMVTDNDIYNEPIDNKFGLTSREGTSKLRKKDSGLSDSAEVMHMLKSIMQEQREQLE